MRFGTGALIVLAVAVTGLASFGLAKALPYGGQIRVFLIDQDGAAVPRAVPGIVSVRMIHSGMPKWLPPRTVSNQNAPPDFDGRLAQTIDAGPDDRVAIGVYDPTGYRVLKLAHDERDCAWQAGAGPIPKERSLYEEQAGSHVSAGPADTLEIAGPASGVLCVTFMLEKDPAYAQFGKVDVEKYGTYHENAWSSAIGLQNVRPDKITTLRRASSNSAIQLDVSETIGAEIVHFFISDPERPNDPSRIQLIKSNDAGDSGLQWSAVMTGVNFGTIKDAALGVDQVVGADPTWMWGMEMPLVQTENNAVAAILATPPGVWVPNYTARENVHPIVNQWDPLSFTPHSPLFRPNSVRLFDARAEQIGVRIVPAPAGGTIANVISDIHVRSHLLFPIAMKFYRAFEWEAYNRDGPGGGLAHHMQMYVVKPSGESLFLGQDRTASSLEQAWPIPPSFGRRLGKECTPEHCDELFQQLNRVVLVFDPCPNAPCARREQVVSIHLPSLAPFSAETNFSAADRDARPPRNSGFGVFMNFDVKGSRTGDTSVTIGPDYNNGPDGKGDSIIYSVGRNEDLNSMTPKLGY